MPLSLIDFVQFLEGMIRLKPDAYLDELKDTIRQRTGKTVSLATTWRALTRAGFTMKKVCMEHPFDTRQFADLTQLSKNALERNEAVRRMYRYTFGRLYTADQAVFVDESSFDRRTEIRGWAWALSGKAAVRKAFFIRGKRCASLLLFTDQQG